MNDYQSILKEIKDRVNGRDLKDFKFRVPVLKFPFLEDGFKIGELILSVQASEYHYSTPRTNSKEYTHVEVGFPNFKFSKEFILKYAEDVENPLDTVYAYVPIEELADELYKVLFHKKLILY